MDSVDFKSSQPVFYKTLLNSVKNDKLAHAFLLCGDIHQVKKMAIFLSQTIVCEEDLACGECYTCNKIREGTYMDFILVDGSEKQIKKEDVLNIQKQFKKTAVEGKARMYILHCVDNCRPETINSLLKMMEEPQPGVYAIFTTSNIDKVLDTVVSRSQVIRVKQLDLEHKVKELETIMSKEDATILGTIFQDSQEIKDMYETGLYLKIKDLVIEYFNADRQGRLGVFLHKELVARHGDKQEIEMFLNLVILLYKDALNYDEEKTIQFIDHASLISRINQAESGEKILSKIMILAKAKDNLATNANLGLLMDHIIYRMEETRNGRNR